MDQVTTAEAQVENEETIRIVAWCVEHGFPAEVVGTYVWLTFEEKPDEALRTTLKEAGFRWAPKRKQWMHRCGDTRRGTYRGGHPRDKYGSTWVRPTD